MAAKLPFPYNVPPPIQAAAALPMPNLRLVLVNFVVFHFDGRRGDILFCYFDETTLVSAGHGICISPPCGLVAR